MVRTKTNPTTSNDAAPAANSLAAPAPQTPKPVRLRVRGPSGPVTLDLQTTTPLQCPHGRRIMTRRPMSPNDIMTATEWGRLMTDASAGLVGGSMGVMGTLAVYENNRFHAKQRSICAYCEGTGFIKGASFQSSTGDWLRKADGVCINCEGTGLSIPATLDKAREARKMIDESGYDIRLEIDGGVRSRRPAVLCAFTPSTRLVSIRRGREWFLLRFRGRSDRVERPRCSAQVSGANIKEVAEAGVDMFVAGSAIFRDPRTEEAYKKTIDAMRDELAAAKVPANKVAA